MPAVRWALITGASEGIGRAMAGVAAADGWNLVISARNLPRLEELAADLHGRNGVRVVPVAADLSQPGAAEMLWQQAVVAAGGGIGALVNNAGFGTHGSFGAERDTLSAERALIAVNITALTELAHLAMAHMRAAGAGHILNVASTAAFMPTPKMAVYGASKAYVLSLCEALATEAVGTGVTVSVLCPGATATEFFDRANTGTMALMRLGRMPGPGPVARAGWRGMRAGRRIIVPGWINKVSAFGPRLGPRALVAWVAGKMLAAR